MVQQAVRGATLLIALLATAQDQPYIAVVLLALGVPHGAADHLIHQLTSRDRSRGTSAFARFYLGVMSVYVLTWIYLPTVAFALFLAVSIYHFGQTRGGKLADQLIWGCFYLGFPVLVHYPDARPIIEGMLDVSCALPDWLSVLGPTGMAVAAAANAVYRRRSDQLIDLAILIVLYLSTELLLGFAVFFLLWHSLPATVHQYHFIRRRLDRRGLRSFLRLLLPLSGAALVYLGVAYALIFGFGNGAPALSKVFVLISVITLPHALLIDRIYRFKY